MEGGFPMLTKIMKWNSMAALLVTVLFPQTGENYRLVLNFGICMGAILVIRQALQAKQQLWAGGFIGIALLFNPMVDIVRRVGYFYLLMVLLSFAMFGISLVALKTRHLLSIPSITDSNRVRESL
jgi:hypothetical protein